MGPEEVDPRMMRVQPRIRYNTIGGVNGPLVILENVSGIQSKAKTSGEHVLTDYVTQRSSSRASTKSSPSHYQMALNDRGRSSRQEATGPLSKCLRVHQALMSRRRK